MEPAPIRSEQQADRGTNTDQFKEKRTEAVEDVVVFDGSSFTYDGESSVFHDLNLRIPAGQFLCILGDNGSGKSTLAKCINGLVTPDEGRVLTFGCSTADDQSMFYIRSNAGLVFQNPGDQIVASVVENDVAFGPENLGVPLPQLADHVKDALVDVGLQSHHLHETATLSGGQKQRVAIAGILAMKPAVLVLDEASSMLDQQARTDLMEVCEQLHAEGMTIIMITHLHEEARHADRVIRLEAGQIVQDGTPDQVLGRPDEGKPHTVIVPEEEAASPTSCDPSTPSSPSPEREQPLIMFEDASFTYGGESPSWVFQHVDLSIYEGEFIGVVGSNGSGKSTFLQHLNGLLHPTQGRVLFQGEDMAQTGRAEKARREVGLVFQNPENQLFAETVFKDVAFGPRNQNLPEAEVDRRVREALESVGLDFDAIRDQNPFALSGGQQRRVAIAGILAMQPRVLVMDEPFVGLDSRSRTELQRLIRNLNADGVTCVMVSHYLDALAVMADRIFLLQDDADHLRYNSSPCGRGSMVELELPKLTTRVRFPSPAPLSSACSPTPGSSHSLGVGPSAPPSRKRRFLKGRPKSPRATSPTSFVASLDPRTKLLLSLAFMAIVFVAHDWLGLGICALFTAGFYGAGRIPLTKGLRTIAPFLFIVVITALLNLFFVTGGPVLFQWGIISVSEEGLHRAAFMAVRLTLLLLGVSLFTLTTSELDITEAFERLLMPFSRIGLPAHELAMMMGIAFRFLPQFAEEAKTVYRAQISRGAKITANPFRRGAASLSSFVVPLFASAFRHADTLSMAMEARCYHGGTGRTRLHPLHMGRRDAAAVCVFTLMFICVVAA